MNWPRFYSILFIVLLVLPTIQRVIPFIREPLLYGVTKPLKPIEWKISEWFNGNFQKRANSHFERNLAFRPFFIKNDNQLNFSLFRYISSNCGAKIYLGKKNYLYEDHYVNSLNAKDIISEKIIEDKIKKMFIIQKLLKERGITFFFVLSPSKASILPEYIPSRYLNKNWKNLRTNYHTLLPFLEKYKINYFDSRKFFLKQKEINPNPIMLKGGTHWSYYGACLVINKVLEKIKTLSNKNIHSVSCDPPHINRKPWGTDKDLDRLINIWDRKATAGLTAHPTIKKIFYERTPKFLFIGSSFVNTLTDVMEEVKLYSNAITYFYFRRRFTYPEKHSSPIRKEHIDWKNDLFNKNFVLLEVNEQHLKDLGWGFLESLKSFLYQTKTR